MNRAVILPKIVASEALKPKERLWLETRSAAGPGVAVAKEAIEQNDVTVHQGPIDRQL